MNKILKVDDIIEDGYYWWVPEYIDNITTSKWTIIFFKCNDNNYTSHGRFLGPIKFPDINSVYIPPCNDIVCNYSVDILTSLYNAMEIIPPSGILAILAGATQEIQALRGL
jgi:hypothetical protein